MRPDLSELSRSLVRAASDSPVVSGATIVGVVVFARMVLAQLLSLALPLSVYEGHHWREAFTYGVAWNFAHTTLDVLHPRMFVELAQSNVVPMEAPLYPFLASLLMRAIGDSVVAPRLLSVFGLAATATVLWRWLAGVDSRSVLPERAGLLVALALAPMASVEFRAIQPEPFAAGLAILAALQFARYAERARLRDVAAGGVLFGLSLLAKPVALGVAPGLVAFAAWGRGGALRRGMYAAATIAVAVLPWTAWDAWAHHLLNRDLKGDWIIEIGHPPRALLQSILGGQWTRVAILDQLPSFASSWWLVPAVVLGMYRGVAERRHWRYAIPFLVWLAGYIVQLLAIGIRLHSNAYYVILGTAPLAYFAALGLGAVVRVLDPRRTSVASATFRAGLATALLLPLGWMFSRPAAWSNTLDAAELGSDKNRLVWTSDVGLARLLVVVVLVLAASGWLRRRSPPAWLALPCAILIAFSGIRPANDAMQYFRFYIGAERRAGFDEELGKLRSAVARWSAPQERILLSPGGTYREPLMVYYYYALRNGFPFREAGDDRRAVERGARLYLQVDQLDGTTHLPLASGPSAPLASGAWWKLHCLAKDGCGER